jgi:hypothetical protein
MCAPGKKVNSKINTFEFLEGVLLEAASILAF